MNTKKILLYGGGALVLGAVTFFVWSFFQKPTIPIGDTTISLGSQNEQDSTETQSQGQPDSSNTTNEPVVANNSNSGGVRFDPNVNNPFQPLDDQAYSDLDAFIHRGV